MSLRKDRPYSTWKDPERQSYQTPPELFQSLHKIFHFTVDACASSSNALLPKFWSEEDSALEKDWSKEIVFCNPPFNNIGPFLPLARKAKKALVLVPLNCLTAVFVHATPPDWVVIPKSRIQFIFKGKKVSPMLGSCFLIYGNCPKKMTGLILKLDG